MGKLKDQLAGIAALIAAVVAIGGGFATYGKLTEKIKNPLKNLQLKNLLKMDAMVDNQLSLDSYNVAFYAPKDIYLDQLNMIDNRLIYADKSLATYIQNDKMEIKARKLMEINSRKQQLLIELEVLKNG